MKNALYFAVFSQKKPCIFDLDHYNTRHISDAGWSSLVARRAHNPKAVGSNPAPATNTSSVKEPQFGVFLYKKINKTGLRFFLKPSLFLCLKFAFGILGESFGRSILATLEQKLQDMLQGAVEDAGCQLWGIECQRSGRFMTVRIFIDKDGGVTVDDCADVSRDVSAILDVEDPIADKYNLEVSSPGLDRPLFTLAQYARYIGETINVYLRIPVADRRKWQGKLEKIDNDMLTLLVDDKEQVLVFGNIQKGNLVAKF